MSKNLEGSIKVGLILLWFIFSTQLVGPMLLKLLWQGDINRSISFYEAHQYSIHLLGQILGLGVMIFVDMRCGVLNFHCTLPLKQTIKYMVLGIGVWLFTSIINAFLLPYFPGYEAINELFVNDELFLRFLVIVIAAPLVEEYFFRGKIQGKLKETFGVYYAVPVQAILFGMLHALALQKIYATVIGIIFGIVKEKEEHLWSTIVMHMTINMIGFLIGTLAVS